MIYTKADDSLEPKVYQMNASLGLTGAESEDWCLVVTKFVIRLVSRRNNLEIQNP